MYENLFDEGYQDAINDMIEINELLDIEELFYETFTEEQIFKYLTNYKNYTEEEAIIIMNEGFFANLFTPKWKRDMYKRAQLERGVRDAQDNLHKAKEHTIAVQNAVNYDINNANYRQATLQAQKQENKLDGQNRKATRKLNFSNNVQKLKNSIYNFKVNQKQNSEERKKQAEINKINRMNKTLNAKRNKPPVVQNPVYNQQRVQTPLFKDKG